MGVSERLARILRLLLIIGIAGSLHLEVQPMSPAPAAAGQKQRGYVSIIFGRTQWVSVGYRNGLPCQRLPNTVTLGSAREALSRRGLRGVGVVILPRTPETGFRCFAGYTLHPGWDRLKHWRTHGWAFVSGGTHRDIRQMSHRELVAETCGSLKTFRDHKIPGWGMWAYANNKWTLDAQKDPVSRCFSFGRRYARWRINEKATTGWPWFQWTHSVNGGKCNDSSLRCYRSAGAASSRYDPPARLASLMAAQPRTWVSIQFYRFVTGSYHGGSRWTWDCTGHDWRRHYTSQWELYCYRDFLRVMNALERQVGSGAVRVGGPAMVGRAWDRMPSGRG